MSEEWDNATPATVPRGTGQQPDDFKTARRQKAALVEPAKLDRLPPHSIEGEQGVLGCILLSPADCLSECAARLLQPGHFYDLRHQMIYHAVTELFNKSGAVDQGRRIKRPVGAGGRRDPKRH